MDPEDLDFSPEHLAALIDLADSGAVNNQVAKKVFERIFEEDADPVAYVEEHGLKTVNDAGALEQLPEKFSKKTRMPPSSTDREKRRFLAF